MPSDQTVGHVYVHVPFCRRRCVYCDFSIAVRRSIPHNEFVAAVRQELDWHATGDWWPGPAKALDTVYFGGGTPSLVEPEAFGEILQALADHRAVASDAEVTVEANPEDVTPGVARAWRNAGVTRVSLGVQSFDDAALRWMHRSHGPDASERAVDTLRSEGLAEVSIDLIFALPEELERSWASDLERGIALDVPHVSLYGLTAEPRTPLGKWVERGSVHPSSDDRYVSEYLEAHDRLTAAGYSFYEVSNACRPGHAARHNGAYWKRRGYLGLGPSAHSFVGGCRWWNVRPWEDYRQTVSRGRDPREEVERLTAAQERTERIYLGLRTADGLARHQIPDRVAERWESAGLARCDDGWVRLTPDGWLVMDRLIGDLTGDPKAA